MPFSTEEIQVTNKHVKIVLCSWLSGICLSNCNVLQKNQSEVAINNDLIKITNTGKHEKKECVHIIINTIN